MALFETVTDLAAGAEVLRRRRFGLIEVADGRLTRIHLRPWPKVVSAPGILTLGAWFHDHLHGDRLWLYYNQPWRFSNFLVLRYAVSARETSFASLRTAAGVLDEIARLKQSDALLTDVANWRISTKALARFGWVPHCPMRWHRHYIKRFYGQYPEPIAAPL